MAQPPIGIQEAVGIGVEATYGTPVTPGVWFRPTAFSLRRAWVPLSMQGMTGSGADVIYSATAPRAFRAAPVIAGQIGFEADYNHLGWLMYFFTGTTSEGVGSGPTWDNTWNIGGSASNNPAGLTIARTTGNVDLRFTGCKITGMTISGSPGATVQVTLDIVGQDGGDAEADDTPDTADMGGPWLEFQHSNIMYHGSVAQSLTPGTHKQSGDGAIASWSLGATQDLRIAEAAGTGLIREPVRQGYTQTSLTFGRDWADTTFLAKMAQASIEDVFCSLGVNVTDTTNEFDAQMAHALLVGDQGTEMTSGVIPENITAKGGDNLSTAPLVVSLTGPTEDYNQAGSAA